MDRWFCDKHDAYYDADDDTWISTICKAAKCRYCTMRPESPSKCRVQRGHTHKSRSPYHNAF